MGALSAIEGSVHFGRDLPPEVDALLQEAAAFAHDADRAPMLLRKARALAPERIEVCVALYKYCFYRGSLEEAEEVVRLALAQSALQGGFDPDWHRLGPESADWSDGEGPGRIFLFSLKALAFILLRRDDALGAEAILGALARIDPDDRIGAEVVRSLAAGAAA
jgi:hypothetical protein